MKIQIFDEKNLVNQVTLSEIWDKISPSVLHQVIVARQANKRQGTASTLTKSEVHGGGKKPFRQKGLGRARAGSLRSPLWRGGGVIFGPKPRDYSKAVNKKQKIKAYITVLNLMNKQGRLIGISEFKIETHRTKDFLKSLSKLVDNTSERIVLVTADYDKNLMLASRNLPNITYMGLDYLDILPLIYAAKILITENAIKELDKRFSNSIKVGK